MKQDGAPCQCAILFEDYEWDADSGTPLYAEPPPGFNARRMYSALCTKFPEISSLGAYIRTLGPAQR